MDSFSPKQLAMMSVGGNNELSEFFNYYSLESLSLEQKYRTVAAYFYREKLSFASDGIFIDKQRPSSQDGRQILEEERKVFVSSNVEQPKSTFSTFIEKTVESTKELKDKMTEISMKDVEDKVRESIHSAGIKEKLKKAKKSAGKFYHHFASGAKNVFKNNNKEVWYEGRLFPGEDELLLDPEHCKEVKN
jgi:ADP-ribosylation factor GTPase-activating protein 2/3